MSEAQGDRQVAAGLVFDRLHDMGYVSAEERRVLAGMHELGAPSPEQQHGHLRDGRSNATAAYLQVRRRYDEMLAKGDAGPVAMVLAASITGSYEEVDGGDGTTVVYAKSNRNYQAVLAGYGAVIGGVLGGGAGGAGARRRDRRRDRLRRRRLQGLNC